MCPTPCVEYLFDVNSFQGFIIQERKMLSLVHFCRLQTRHSFSLSRADHFYEHHIGHVGHSPTILDERITVQRYWTSKSVKYGARKHLCRLKKRTVLKSKISAKNPHSKAKKKKKNLLDISSACDLLEQTL